MKKVKVYISVDIGSDVTKSAYAYSINGRYFHDKLQINGTDFLSTAYYNPDEDDWKFGRDIYSAAKDNFRYLVMIGDLLSLFHTKDENSLYDGFCLFKNFYFPPLKEAGDYQQMVRANMCFETEHDTPRDVCEKFLTVYCKKILAQADRVLKNRQELKDCEIEYDYVLVYPSNASLKYIEELMTLLKKATGTFQDPKLISASKAIGAAAREYGLIDVSSPKRALLFNVGRTETSVIKVKIDRDNIYSYRLKADASSSGVGGKSANELCNEPIKVGGYDFDMVLNDLLASKSNLIPPFGCVGDNANVERGSYYAQFMTMQDIKNGKALFSNGSYYDTVKEQGVEFTVRREMSVPIQVKKEDFAKAAAPVFEKLWKFAESKLKLGCNNESGGKIDTVLFAGGGSDTYGLEAYIKAKLAKSLATRNISYVDFSPADKDKGYEVSVCKSSYAAAIGAALFAVGKYKFKIVTTKAYGTAVRLETKCSIIIPKGDEIPLKGKLIENDTRLRTFYIPAKYNYEKKRHEWNDAFYKLDYDGEIGSTIELNDYARKRYDVVTQRAIVVFDENTTGRPVLQKGQDFYFTSLGKNGLPCKEGFIIDCEGRGNLVAIKDTIDYDYRNISVHIDDENMEMD